MWDELGIDPCDDPKAVRRAYAALLKKLDPDKDPAAFARLREALEWALAEIDEGTSPQFQPPRARSSEPDTGQDRWNDFNSLRPNGDVSREPVLRRPDEPGAGDVVSMAAPDWLDVSTSERTLLDAFEGALGRRDAAAALSLFYRALLPLQDALAQLDRLFALVVEDTTIEPAAFRDLARTFGWDRQAQESGTSSELRQRVLARLAAEDWYDSLVAAAAPRAPVSGKHAKIARLMLRRIGRYRMPRVDSAELETRLDEFRIHQAWLRHRIDPAWAATLEKRWRRREIFWFVFFVLFIAAMMLNGILVFVMEAVAGTLSLGAIAVAPFAAAFLMWIMKLLVTGLYRLIKKKPITVIDPPKIDFDSTASEDSEARLRWLEQRAELAYEAMYDAPAGSATAAHYSDVKEFMYDAIALARRLGHAATAERLTLRLSEIKAVYRSQFTV
jgi:curved DNA-binding protein CbpA